MIKNILNYIKILICFVVSSLLLLSSSYAFVPNQYYTMVNSGNPYVAYSSMNSNFNSDVSFMTLSNTIYGYYEGNTVTQEVFDSVISSAENTHNIYIWKVPGSNTIRWGACLKSMDLAHYVASNNGYLNIITNSTTYNYYDCFFTYVRSWSNTANCYYKTSNIPNGYWQMDTISELLYSSVSIYECTYVSGGTCYGDGSYWYTVTPPAPPEPSYIPTNEEIADKVQEFYDSDFFQNQSDFKDFFVLYNYNNQTFSFIGHNLGDNIGQVIYRSNFPQNTTGVDYWSFYLVNATTHIWNWFNNYYWLYTTTLDSETITYTGKGAVTDLLDLKFNPTYSTIVYSTTDYPCVIYGWDDTNNEITEESETISGDSYTYDENINPTTSEYNPITNYVLPNSIDTLISNADIPGLLQIWVTPDFSNMDWIFLSISAFWGYFGGFVLLTAIMFFIMWLLRGD